MEELGAEEQMVGNTHIAAKGKRTKRLRLFSPSGVAVMTSSCSSASGGDNGSFSSTTTTYESADQEEEDMANCLILLAQGGGQSQTQSHHHHHHHQHVAEYHGDGNNKTEKGSTNNNRRFAENEIATATATATTNTNTNTKVGFYIYECKTCNRTFPSFQALGGHRASHKRAKLMPEEKKPQPPPPPPPQLVTNNYDEFEEAGKPRGPTISLQLVGSNGHRALIHGNKAKIHECSICGSEFTSGQALGGHMRRHRASSSSTNATAETADDGGVRPRNILELDLNLPAPEDDLRESKFQFPATQKTMMLSAAPALVDCHY